MIEQAVEWVENQKDHIRNYRKRCAQYKGMLKNDIKEKEKQRTETSQRLADLEEKEVQKNAKQMHKVLEKEQKIATDRRIDRQNADFLSKYNIQQRRQSNHFDQSLNSLNIHSLNLFHIICRRFIEFL